MKLKQKNRSNGNNKNTINKLSLTVNVILLIAVILLVSIKAPTAILGFISKDGSQAEKINRLDINKDGLVDITDVLALKRHVLVATTDDTEDEWYIADQEIDTTAGTGTGVQIGEEISKETTKSYQGYYADVDRDGTVDGIIYADLLAESGMSGKWVDNNGSFTIPTVTTEELKDYIISKTGHTEECFGTHDVIQLKDGSVGTDRFYVMSLTDIKTDSYFTFYWYRNAVVRNSDDTWTGKMTDYKTATSTDFGAGKQNTITIKRKWDYGGYGAKDERDIWGHIKTEIDNGWFVPSRGEWAAFLQFFGVNTKNYFYDYGLSSSYWSSSQYSSSEIWQPWLSYSGHMNSYVVDIPNFYIRLSTIF